MTLIPYPLIYNPPFKIIFLMNKKIIFIVLLIFILGSKISIFAQENNPDELMGKVGPMMELLMKYENNTKSPNQEDFDKMLNKMGIMDEIQNDKSDLTKEDAFQFINAYINADQGEKIVIDEQNEGEVMDFLNEIEKGKQNALTLLNEATTDDKMSKMMEEASNELYNSGFFRSNSVWFTYDEFKALTIKEYPKAKEGQIKAAYNYFIEKLENNLKIGF